MNVVDECEVVIVHGSMLLFNGGLIVDEGVGKGG